MRLLALLTAAMGLVNVLSAATAVPTKGLALLASLSPLEVRLGSRLAAALAGFALLHLSLGLRRRKRVAWLLTLAVLSISAVSHLLKSLDYEEAALSGLLALGLWVSRDHFHARSDAPSVRQGLLALAMAFAFTLVYGTAGFYLLDRQFNTRFDLWTALRQTAIMFTEFGDPGPVGLTRLGRYFADSIYVIATATFGYALVMLARPVFIRHPSTSAERARAASIVEAHGRSSLARLTLLDDKAYFFSAGGSVIAFVARGRVALALGDPVGPADDLAPALADYQTHCQRNDWQPAFYQVSPEALDIYRAAGFQALCIGHEALVNLERFTLEGKAGKELRSTINKLARLGYRAEPYTPPVPDRLLHELRAVSDEWLTLRRGRELRFATGWFDPTYVRSCPGMLTRAPDGHVTAFASLVPLDCGNGLGVDLMRRRARAEPGTMDFLFASLFAWARAQGYRTFSLGLSALSGVGTDRVDPVLERALGYLGENAHRFYNFKGLHAFKEKYRPQWEPRYLIYPGSSSLPAVAVALVQASAGRDFAWWYLRRR